MSRTAFILGIATYAAALFIMAPLTARMEDQENSGLSHFVNSDVQYVPSLVHDLRTGIRTNGWSIPPANYFFPDALVLGVCTLLLPSPSNVFVSGLLLFSLNTASLILLLRTIRGSFIDAPYALMGASILILALPLALLPGPFFALVLPTFHTSAIGGALLFLTVLAAPHLDSARPWLLGGITFLWGASDALFLGLAGSALAAHVFFQARAGGPSRRDLFLFGLFIAAAWLGRKSMDWLPMHVVRVSPEGDVLQFLKNHFSAPDLWLDLKHPWYLTSFLVSVWFLFRAVRSKQIAAKWYAYAAAMSLGCILGASFFSRQVGLNGILDRYASYSVFFLLLPVTLAARLPVARMTLIGAALLASLASALSIQGPARVPPVLERAACLDELAAQFRLTNGIADYWNAKAITMATSAVKLNQVNESLGPRVWISNANWYLKPDGSILRYSFILPAGLSEADILSRFGPPRLVQTCAGQPVWIYSTDGSEPLAPFSAEELSIWRSTAQ